MIRIKVLNQEIAPGVMGVEAIYYTEDWMDEDFKNSLIAIEELPIVPFSEEFDYVYGVDNGSVVLVPLKKNPSKDQEIADLKARLEAAESDNLTTLEALADVYEMVLPLLG